MVSVQQDLSGAELMMVQVDQKAVKQPKDVVSNEELLVADYKDRVVAQQKDFVE